MISNESIEQGTPDQAAQADMRFSAPGTIAVATVVLVAVGVATGCTKARHDNNKPPVTTPTGTHSVLGPGQIDILAGNWNYMPGVERQGSSLHVSPTDFKIVHQDGSGGQPNPPVNLYGTRVTFSKKAGDFSVTSTVVNNHGAASVRLYDAAPLVSDEFRVEPGSVSVTETGDKLDVQVMDGSDQADVSNPQPVYEQSFVLPDNANGSLTIAKHGGSIDITDGKKPVTSVPYGSIFKSGNLLFGLDSNTGGFDVSGFTAQGLGGNKLTAIDTTKEKIKKTAGGLQELANHNRPGFKVGAAVALGPLTSDKAYAEQVVNNFNSITLENAMKPQFISPEKGVYDFGEADAIIAFAKKHNIAVHGHCIAFSEAEPSWMQELPTGTAVERAATAKILLDYAKTVATHFKNDLYSLDVVNEPFDTDNGTTLQKNIWYRALGPDYAADVFQVVHQAAPKVNLFLNENGAEQAGPRQDAVVNYAIALKKKGVPIKGVGFQSHVYNKNDDIIYPEDLTAAMNKLGRNGLKSRVSEMDVPADAAFSEDDAEAGAGAQYQAWQYSGVAKACYDNPYCIGFTPWGFNNRYDVYQNDDGSLAHGQDLLINANDTPTLAYKSLQRLFSGK